jgi:hypothetical protein
MVKSGPNIEMCRKSLVHILGSGTPGKVIPDLSPLKRLASNTGAYSNEVRLRYDMSSS